MKKKLPEEYEAVLIKNGKIVDGTGSPWFSSDILIGGDKIEKIGMRLKVKADKVIDAQGMVVAPGFVDAHNHVEGSILFRPDCEEYITQGITTEKMGDCGFSAFPNKKSFIEHWLSFPVSRQGYTNTFLQSSYDWNSGTEYYNILKEKGIAVNVVPYIGAGTIAWDTGYRVLKEADARRVTPGEMEKMKALVRKGMEEGARGLSVGMDYCPQRYIPTDQLIELEKVAAEYGGIFPMHVTASATPEGLEQAIEIAKAAGIPLRIAHLNAAPACLPGFPEDPLGDCIKIIDKARAEGMDIAFDVIQQAELPVPAKGFAFAFYSIISQYAPELPEGAETMESYFQNLRDPAFRELIKLAIIQVGGLAARWLGVFAAEHADMGRLINTGDPEFEDRTLGEIANKLHMKPQDLLFDLVFGVVPGFEDKDVYIVIPAHGTRDREGIMRASRHILACPSTDLAIGEHMGPTPPPINRPHTYSIMATFYRDQIEYGIPIEEPIRKMSSFAAQQIGLTDRGILKEGLKADIVIFDPETFAPKATMMNPYSRAEGMKHVIINGVVALDNGELTKSRPGEVLLKTG